MDMFLPSVPVIAHSFGTVPGAAQHCVTTYLLGLALGQLVWGPVSDRFGRKPVLLAGLGLFLVSSACGAAAQSVQELILIRFAQGFGMSSGQAVALGGWPAVFWVFAAIALALLAAVFFGLRETAPGERPSIAPGRIAASYAVLFGDARFRAALITMLLAQLGIIAFVSASSLVMVQALNLTPTTFSLLFAVVMLGQIIGGIIGSRLVIRAGMGRMVRLGVALAFAGGLLLAALALAGAAHWSAVVLPMVLYLFGCSLMLPSAASAALSPFPQMAGAASSMLGALPFGAGAAVSAALAAAYDGTTRPMALAICAFGTAAFFAERLYFRKIVHG